MTITIGCDPELFVKRGDTLVSAHDLIPGDKRSPHKVECGAVQPDGLAAEFNINPAQDADAFVFNINTVLRILKGMIPNGELVIAPAVHFADGYIASLPEKATTLGCDPDFNAYTGAPNKAPDQHPTLRTASGHVHMGWTEGQDVNDPEHIDDCRVAAKQLDFYLGVPSVLFDTDGAHRRAMYGQAGCFRPKPYGVEYRVLSNWWLKDEKYMRWVFTNAKAGMEQLMSGQTPKYTCIAENYLQRLINEPNNIAGVEGICKYHNLLGDLRAA